MTEHRKAPTPAPTPKAPRTPVPQATEAGASQAVPDLSERQRRHLRGLAHALKPVIRLGNAGVSEALAAETRRALHDHELIKVKASGGDREARDALFAELARRSGSALVQRIGNVAVLYRPREGLAKILLPEPEA